MLQEKHGSWFVGEQGGKFVSYDEFDQFVRERKPYYDDVNDMNTIILKAV